MLTLPPSSALTTNPKKCMKSPRNKTMDYTHLTSEQRTKWRQMNLGMGTLEECNYSRVPTTKPWSINHQHLPSLEEDKSLHIHVNFGVLPQTLTKSSRSHTKCPNMSGPMIREVFGHNRLRFYCLQVQPVTCSHPPVFLYKIGVCSINSSQTTGSFPTLLNFNRLFLNRFIYN